jgi:hypothetical protein
MISRSEETELRSRERADYGFARVRDLAFDAVKLLWDRRRKDGMKQTDLANAIGRDPAWVSRSLRAPGNWTLRTIGELVEAMEGEVEIVVHANEDMAARGINFDAYTDYQKKPKDYPPPPAMRDSSQILDGPQQRDLRSKSPLRGLEDATQEVG